VLKKLLLTSLGLTVFLYALVGEKVLYKNAPAALGVLEHLTCWSPGPCKVRNIKALRGTGEIRWVVVENSRTNKETEHVRGFAGGQTVDTVCPTDKCAERALCAQVTVKDYSIVASHRGECRVKDYELKYNSLQKYVHYALKADRVIDRLMGRSTQSIR
jgi:hypothetical protein